MKHAIIFINEPKRNPTKEPTAALNARLESWLAIISPMKAPINGPRMTPHGPIQNARINPNVHPHTPYFVPPNRLVPPDWNEIIKN